MDLISNQIWHNGKLKDYKDSTTHVMSHALHYGSGVFEGIRAYQLSNNNLGILALKEHVSRLFASAKYIAIDIPYTEEDICNAIINVVKVNGCEPCYIRPLVYYGLAPTRVRILPNLNTPIEVIISSYNMGEYIAATEGLHVLISKYVRPHPNSTAIEAKICGNYVNSLQALLEIKDTKYEEVIMLDHEGYVAEGSSANIFMVINKVIYTPSLGNILNGITRQLVIKLANELGYQVIECKMKPQELFKCEEVFFTGTAFEIRNVCSINDSLVGDGKEGDITKAIKEAYHNICLGKEKNYLKYLTLVNK